jgi:hypothetical protein
MGANMSACPSSTSAPSESSQRIKSIMSITTAIVFAIGGSAFLILVFVCLRRRNAKLRQLGFESDVKSAVKPENKLVGSEKAESVVSGSHGKSGGSFHGSTPDFSIIGSRSRVLSDRSTSTTSRGLSSPAEWSSWIHLGELETATNYFSEKNLLRRNAYTAVYKGTLRDGTAVAVKAIYNTRFAFGEQDFEMAIEALMQVKHENLVKFLGFCVSKGGSECFLVYSFIPDGSLEHHLHGRKDVSMNWRQRVTIIRGIAKGSKTSPKSLKLSTLDPKTLETLNLNPEKPRLPNFVFSDLIFWQGWRICTRV